MSRPSASTFHTAFIHPKISDCIWGKHWYPQATQDTSSSRKQAQEQQMVTGGCMEVTQNHPRVSAVGALSISSTATEQHWENKHCYQFQLTQLLVKSCYFKSTHWEVFPSPAAYFVWFEQNPWTLILAVLNWIISLGNGSGTVLKQAVSKSHY